MDESKNPQPALAAFNFPDLHSVCAGKTDLGVGRRRWVAGQLLCFLQQEKKPQKQKSVSSASGWTIMMLMHGH